MPIHKNVLPAMLALMFCSQIAVAQNCKFVKEKKDAFTNEQTRFAKVFLADDCLIQLQRDSKTFTFSFYIKKHSIIDKTLMPGHKVYFRLENGEIKELVLDKDCTPSIQKEGTSQVSTYWLFTVPVDQAYFEQFAKSRIMAARTTIDGHETTVEVKEKQRQAIQDTFICMLQE